MDRCFFELDRSMNNCAFKELENIKKKIENDLSPSLKKYEIDIKGVTKHDNELNGKINILKFYGKDNFKTYTIKIEKVKTKEKIYEIISKSLRDVLLS